MIEVLAILADGIIVAIAIAAAVALMLDKR